MKVIVTTLILFFLLACEKEEDRSCFKTVGADSSKEIAITATRKLDLKSDITYFIYYDTIERVVVKGGKNLLNFVDVVQNGDQLTIENNNGCSFLRNYKDDITVEIYVSNLKKIEFAGSKKLMSTQQLQLDSLTINAYDGSGVIDLNLQTSYLKLSSDFGYTDFIIRGQTNYLSCRLNGSSYANLYNCEILDSITVVSDSQRDILVKPNGVKLKAQLNQSGNVLYKGIPSSIFYMRFGKGELINAN
ncbi:MAG: DUF2807 domain-containing protein [Crocinitomicaceae bacterium]|nr:DUF2807 domain-containing protein [Crocinitomicaceae bacterium]